MVSSHVCKKLVVVVWRIRVWWCWPNSDFINNYVCSCLVTSYWRDLEIWWFLDVLKISFNKACRFHIFVRCRLSWFRPFMETRCCKKRFFRTMQISVLPSTGLFTFEKQMHRGCYNIASMEYWDFLVFELSTLAYLIIFDLSILSKFAANGKCSYLMFVNFRFVWVWALHLRMVDLLMLLSPGSNEAFWFPRLVKCFFFHFSKYEFTMLSKFD